MGVKGLTRFIDERQRLLFDKVKIASQCLIIDGNALIYFIFYSVSSSFSASNNYKLLKQEVVKLFQTFARCEIQPIVVFDSGGMPEKQETHLTRQSESVKKMLLELAHQKASQGKQSHVHLLPLLAVFSFQQTLHELNIPVVWSVGDADHDMAVLANQSDSLVLSNDSDFYVFDIAKGYLPLGHLDLQEIHSTAAGCHMHGMVYRSEKLSCLYNVERTFLSFVPVLLGCDWVSPSVCSGLVQRLTASAGHESKRQRRKAKKQPQVEKVLRWLSQCSDIETILAVISDHLSKSPGVDPSLLQWSFNKYRDSEKSTGMLEYLVCKFNLDIKGAVKFNVGTKEHDCTISEQERGAGDSFPNRTEETEPTDATAAVPVSGDSIRHAVCNEKIRDLIRSGRLPSLLASVFTNCGRVLLPVVTSKSHCPSPHACSAHVRSATYRLLYVHLLVPDDAVIVEYDRRKARYAKTSEINRRSLYDCPCACHADDALQKVMLFTNDSNPASEDSRLAYLSDSLLGCKLRFEQRHKKFLRLLGSLRSILGSNKARKFELFLLVTMSWRWSDDINPPNALTTSFLLMLAIALAADDLPGASEQQQIADAFVFDSDVPGHVEEVSQWQCLFHASLILNRTLCFPVPDPTISSLNLPLVARLYLRSSKWKVTKKVDDGNVFC